MIQSPIDTTPAIKAPASDKLSKSPTIMEFRPAKALSQGLKRVGGRGGTSRIGQVGRRGRPIISKRY